MDLKSFIKLKKEGFNHIPITRELIADLDTPLSCYIKVARGPYSYLLESASQGGEKWSRYSVVGLPASKVIKISGEVISVLEGGELADMAKRVNPFTYIEEVLSSINYPKLPELPAYTGGLVGYFGYDTMRYFERNLQNSEPEDVLQLPDIILMFSDDLIIFDNVKGRMHLVTHANPFEEGSYEKAQLRLDEIAFNMSAEVPGSLKSPKEGPEIDEADFVSIYGKENFRSGVDRIKDYIVEGDVMQVVLSQRMSVPFESDPLNFYRALRSLNPSPYMYFLDLDDFQIVSSSPEILAKLEDGSVTVRPLAGTRRRGHDEKEDVLLEKELLNDPKELSEHLMLIDLGRNDVGKVCEPGSISVTEKMVVERYGHVMHLASNVEGRLKSGLAALDVLQATLPVGTLSGAPKIRAMEIIDELEPEKRGIFGGAVGYMSWNGNMDTAIAIRTAIIKGSVLYIQAGAGVVSDSVSENEWQETINKARSIFHAAVLAESGLDVIEKSSPPSGRNR
ncbi:MAG: anthranilate synthase component I [Gammaproteobacteria bacterium]|nr:anthranilate synthase component I [Gammaproteobacteria bacterium]